MIYVSPESADRNATLLNGSGRRNMRLEPEWWARARKLEAYCSQAEIARRLQVSESAVRYALRENARKGALKRAKRSWERHRAAGGTGAGKDYDAERQNVRAKVRRMFIADGGGGPEDLRKLYKRMECA